MLNTRISDAETMADALPRYLDVGKSALRSILNVVGDRKPESILDLPCGHGRVARHLRSHYPEAELFVSDLDEIGAAFCAENFEATSLPSRSDFGQLDFGREFDLIWVGSLITHLPEDHTIAFLGFLARHLTQDGIAVVSSHGAFVAGRLFERNEALYGLSLEQERMVYEDYMNSGYGYQSYRNVGSYGTAVISKLHLDRLARDAGLEMFSFLDHAWDNHQDVAGLRLL